MARFFIPGEMWSAEGVAFWTAYQVRWTRGNHVRLLASSASAVLLTLSLLV